MPKTPCETQSQLGNSQENIGKTWENPLEIEVYSRNIHFKWRLSSQGKLSISKGFLPVGLINLCFGVYFWILNAVFFVWLVVFFLGRKKVSVKLEQNSMRQTNKPSDLAKKLGVRNKMMIMKA
jgi:hypothetical protein